MVRKWIVDAKHSRIGFSISHLGISKIFGQFRNFSGYVEQSRPDSFQDADFALSASAISIDTCNNNRDKRLCSPEFLDVTNYPNISFSSGNIVRLDYRHYIIEGNLSIKGITKPTSLTAHLGGLVRNRVGAKTISFEITGEICSTDFGMQWFEENANGIQIWSESVELHMYLEYIAKTRM